MLLSPQIVCQTFHVIFSHLNKNLYSLSFVSYYISTTSTHLSLSPNLLSLSRFLSLPRKMSVNHYSTDHHHTLLWQHRHTTDTHPPPPETPTTATWLNDDQKESLFEKSLTPSDVGKLNRLVIPKQHAEKYFPLNAVISSAADTSSSSSEKGMLLSFEDESGKCWRFRYSYWNSSQSYVLTKGWSRFVKDKHLDPGDVVFFQRQRSDSRRLFIGWRRRGQGSSSAVNTNTTSYASSMAVPQYLQLHASSNYSIPPHTEYSHYGMFYYLSF